MNREEFSFDKLKEIFSREPVQKHGKTMFRPVSEETKTYVHKYFHIVNNADYYFWDAEDQVLKIYDKTGLQNVYLNYFPDEVKVWFLTSNTVRFKIICDSTKPALENSKINMFKGFLHVAKPYADYSPELKQSVQLMLSFVREVLSSNKPEIFEYLVN